MKIYKYELSVTDEQVVEMPEGAMILTCQAQINGLVLWAIVDPDKPLAKRMIEIVGTGNEFDPSPFHTYIASVQLNGFVWHVFQILL